MSDNSRPSSSQGALLLMTGDDDPGLPSANLLMPCIQPDAPALFSDEEVEADSFVGQTAATIPCDNFKPQPINLFGQTGAVESTDPFSQVQQPEMQPMLQSFAALNKPVELQSFGLPLTSQPIWTPPQANVGSKSNPYAAGSAIAAGRLGHFAAAETYQTSSQTNYLSHQTQSAPSVIQPASLPIDSVRIDHSQISSLSSVPSIGSSGGPSSEWSTRSPQQNFSALPPASIYPPMSPAVGSSEGPQVIYQPVAHHWFYCVMRESRETWEPFSVADSLKIDDMFKTGGSQIVSVEGGRYDVDVQERSRKPVYWSELEPSSVMRCSWFFRRDVDNKFVPFNEQFAASLEESYRNTLYSGDYHKRLAFPSGESVVIHNPQTIIYFSAAAQPDAWGNTTNDSRPSAVRRGLNEFENIPDDELDRIDHLVLMVHGAGATCDLRLRNTIECVNEFRLTSYLIMKTHFQQARLESRAGRVEFLPVRWHNALRGDMTDIDRRLKSVTLNSIKKLRSFTNETLLDILFYGSPVYAQKIIETVGVEVNRLVELFLARNPSFDGKISLAGHSFGSLICFDLLMNQVIDTCQQVCLPGGSNSSHMIQDSAGKVASGKVIADLGDEDEDETLDTVLAQLGLTTFSEQFHREQIDLAALSLCDENDIKEMGLPLGPRKKLLSFLRDYNEKQQLRKKASVEQRIKLLANQPKETEGKQSAVNTASVRDPFLSSSNSEMMPYVVGDAGVGAPLVKYPQLSFRPANFFALGSPVAMFLAVRGISSLGEDFHLPTCPGFFNIFHPFDPVAYRIEPLVAQNCPPKPVLMPHHKGRKRLHLELKESLARMGSDLKQRIIDSVKATWQSLSSFAQAHRTSNVSATVEQDEIIVEREVDDVLTEMTIKADDDDSATSVASSVADEDELPASSINQGRRVDFVLQEKPIEMFNDYLFALGSNCCYWQSEDTALLMLKEIYMPLGVTSLRPSQGGMFQMASNAISFPRPVSGPPPRLGFVPVPATKMLPASSHVPVGLVQPAPRPAVPTGFVSPVWPAGTLNTRPNAQLVNFTSASQPADMQQSMHSGPPPLSGFIKK